MTNYEKYKDKLKSILMDRIGVDYKGTPKSCVDVGCPNCRFYIKHDRRCNNRVAEWLNAEAKEPKKFTKEEKEYARLNDKILYYACDKGGRLYGYTEKPEKKSSWWDSYAWAAYISPSTSLSFSAIKWKDDEPTSREDILNS